MLHPPWRIRKTFLIYFKIRNNVLFPLSKKREGEALVRKIKRGFRDGDLIEAKQEFLNCRKKVETEICKGEALVRKIKRGFRDGDLIEAKQELLNCRKKVETEICKGETVVGF